MLSLLIAEAGQASGRGDDPSTFGGVAVIVGVIVLAIAVIALILFLIGKVTRREERGAP
jgi:hypothetical protein